jgi:hypothetical protein
LILYNEGVPPLTRIEIGVGLASILLGLAGFLAGLRSLELLGLIGTVFTFGVLISRSLLQ